MSNDPTVPITEKERPRRSDLAQRSRLVVVGTVTYASGADAQSVPFKFVRPLRGEEQVYVRHVKVGEEWQALDVGWIERASLIVIENKEGTLMQVRPSEKERDDIQARVIEVGFAQMNPSGRDMHSPAQAALVAQLLVLPGESLPYHPADVRLVRIRCRSGAARATLHIFPE